MNDILLVLLILSMVLFAAMPERKTVSVLRARFGSHPTNRRGPRGPQSKPR